MGLLLLCITYVVSSSAFWDNVFKHRPLWKVGLSPVPGIGHLQDTRPRSALAASCASLAVLLGEAVQRKKGEEGHSFFKVSDVL